MTAHPDPSLDDAPTLPAPGDLTPAGPTPDDETVAVLGAGKLGTVVARLALAAGYRVVLAGSGAPGRIALLADVMAPGAEVAWSRDAAARADVVVLALPLGRRETLPVDELAGRLVLDAMNYWWETDGVHPELEDRSRPTSTLVRGLLPGARVVKALNHAGYHDLDEGARPAGHPERIALGVAGDEAAAVAEASVVVDRLGFDPVHVGDLAGSWVLQPGAPAFGAAVDAATLLELVRRA